LGKSVHGFGYVLWWTLGVNPKIPRERKSENEELTWQGGAVRNREQDEGGGDERKEDSYATWKFLEGRGGWEKK